MKKMLKNQRGLTLIELLAVIVILGIIAAIAVPSVGGIIQNSREDAVKSDAIQILNAAKIYMSSNQAPVNNELDEALLAEFVDGGSITDYTVKVSGNTKDYSITTPTAVNAGNQTMTFTNATLTTIENEAAIKFEDKK